MVGLSLIETERTGDRVKNTVGHSTEIASFETGVVVDADAGEACDLVPPEARHASSTTNAEDTCLLGRQSRSAGGQEVSDLGSVVHPVDHTVARRGQAGPDKATLEST